MIFDIKDAVVILGGVIVFAFLITEYALSITSEEECEHYFAEFQSTGIRKCIDCGYEESIKKPHYPKHQR